MGITAYLKNGDTLEKVASMANYARTGTTQRMNSRREKGIAHCLSGKEPLVWFTGSRQAGRPRFVTHSGTARS